MKLIRKGEYDLVNISLLGYDPVTGKTYEECNKEWKRYLQETIQLDDNTPWWNIPGRIRVRWRSFKLAAKQGMM